MQRMFPKEFAKDDGPLTSSEIVQYRISQYLKEYLQSQKARSAESESGWYKNLFGDTEIESPGSGSGSKTDRPRVRDGASRERTRGRSGSLTETPRTPAKNRVSNLSTPIANLLTDLRTMHDDM
jgi:hypothetical protein